MDTEQTRFANAMDGFFGDIVGDVGVMVRVPQYGVDLVYLHDEVFPTASTMKVPLLYELYRQADQGRIDLDQRITLTHDQRVPGSGVLQEMDEGLQPTVRDLSELMITVSDNYATDLVYNLIGKDAVARMLAGAGLHQTSLPLTIREMMMSIAEVPLNEEISYDALVDRMEHAAPSADNLAYSTDPANDVSSPQDMIRMLELILNGTDVSDASRRAMLKTLTNQNFNAIIPGRLPVDAEVQTAHKTGSLRGIRNDVGIVMAPDLTYIIAIMSRGLEDTAEAVSRMAFASRWVWDHLRAFPRDAA